jgi:ABC-type glycerol-3-phosphate transport system permease component
MTAHTDDTTQTSSTTPPRPSGGLRRRLLKILKRLPVWIPLAALMVWTILPILITLSISFKIPGEVYSAPQLIPANPTLDAYREILNRQGFKGAFVNSVVVGLGTAILTLLVAVPAAYAFARFRFRGRHLLLLFTLLPRLIPSLGLMVPLYRLAVALGALDNRLTLVVVFTGTILPLAVWLLVGFFQQIPRELEEAANVDGTNLWLRIRYIVLPLAVPALITIGVLAFREAWNEFNLVLALTRTAGNRTLPYELWLLQDSVGFANNPGMAAFAIMTLIPFIFIYLRIERYVVGGITAGSTK